MSRSRDTQTSKMSVVLEAEEYLRKHRMRTWFHNRLMELVIGQPENPLQFLRDSIDKELAQTSSIESSLRQDSTDVWVMAKLMVKGLGEERDELEFSRRANMEMLKGNRGKSMVRQWSSQLGDLLSETLHLGIQKRLQTDVNDDDDDEGDDVNLKEQAERSLRLRSIVAQAQNKLKKNPSGLDSGNTFGKEPSTPGTPLSHASSADLGQKESDASLTHSEEESGYVGHRYEQPAALVSATELAPEDDYLAVVFKELDADKNGLLDLVELGNGMKMLGVHSKQNDLSSALSKTFPDENLDKGIDFDQFKKMFQEFTQMTESTSTGWTIKKWLSGLTAYENSLPFAIAQALEPPNNFEGTEFDYMKFIARKPGMLQRKLLRPGVIDTIISVISDHLQDLLKQKAATAGEMNEKFSASADGFLDFGNRKDYEGGLNERIGFPTEGDPVEEIYREHCKYEYSKSMFTTQNYRVHTSPEIEFQGVAGMWEPLNRSYDPIKSFELPCETANCENGFKRKFVSVPELMKKSCVARAELTEPEVIATRLWSGPMYQLYNDVLRNGTKDVFTTTLHALCSAIYKLSRIAECAKVYRGLGGRVIPQKLIGNSVVEFGAQSFTTDKSVALSYAKYSGEESPSYLFELNEGEVDKGADISELSYYPHEKEKLYGPLCLMQPLDSSVYENTVIVQMRCNVNQKAGTLDELRARRKAMLCATGKALHRETGARADVASIEKANQQNLTPGEVASRRADIKEVTDDFERREDPAWFNDPGNFRSCNNALLGTWEGVLNHAALHAEVEGLLKEEIVNKLEKESEDLRQKELVKTTALDKDNERSLSVDLARIISAQWTRFITFPLAVQHVNFLASFFAENRISAKESYSRCDTDCDGLLSLQDLTEFAKKSNMHLDTNSLFHSLNPEKADFIEERNWHYVFKVANRQFLPPAVLRCADAICATMDPSLSQKPHFQYAVGKESGEMEVILSPKEFYQHFDMDRDGHISIEDLKRSAEHHKFGADLDFSAFFQHLDREGKGFIEESTWCYILDEAFGCDDSNAGSSSRVHEAAYLISSSEISEIQKEWGVSLPEFRILERNLLSSVLSCGEEQFSAVEGELRRDFDGVWPRVVEHGVNVWRQDLMAAWMVAETGRYVPFSVSKCAESFSALLTYNKLTFEEGWDAFDRDSDGKLSLEDLQSVSSLSDLDLSNSDLASFLEHLDTERKGFISKHDFCSFLSISRPYQLLKQHGVGVLDDAGAEQSRGDFLEKLVEFWGGSWKRGLG